MNYATYTPLNLDGKPLPELEKLRSATVTRIYQVTDNVGDMLVESGFEPNRKGLFTFIGLSSFIGNGMSSRQSNLLAALNTAFYNLQDVNFALMSRTSLNRPAHGYDARFIPSQPIRHEQLLAESGIAR